MAMRRLPPSRSPMFRSPVLTMTRQNGAGGAGWNGKCARARSLAPQRGWSLRWLRRVWGKVCGSGSCIDRRSNPNAVRRRCYGASYHHFNSKGTHRSDTRRCGATRLDCGTLPASSPTLPWFPPLYLRPPPPCPASISPLHSITITGALTLILYLIYMMPHPLRSSSASRLFSVMLG